MIFVTGDCHSEFQKLSTAAFPEQREMTKDDIVIICGDFGAVWNADGISNSEAYWLIYDRLCRRQSREFRPSEQ